MNNTLDLNRFPKEVLLILEVLKEKDEDLKRNCLERLSVEVDWQLFLEYAIHHRVYPTLYKQLKHTKDHLKVPTFVMQSLERLYKENTFKMLQLSAEMNEIGKLFADHDIDALFLKGPAIAHDLFGDISLRTSKDLDVLIPIDQLEKAQYILKDIGYEQVVSLESLFNEWKWRFKDISFYHPDKEIQVELHWRLNNWPAKEPSFKELWSRRRVSTFTQHPCCFLGEEDLFYYLVTHGARHGWFRLRWLMDVQQFMKRPLDWNSLHDRFERCNNIMLAGQALILASELYELDMTEEMNPLLIKRSKKIANNALFFIEIMENLHDENLSKNIYRYYKKYTSSIRSISQRVLWKLSKLHPIPEDAQVLPLPKFFYFLYFPLRPFLWLSRQRKRQVYPESDFQ